MDRSFQSGLEKKTRVGWQSRVYRVERGYLSSWPDAAAALTEEPSRIHNLFQGKQVAVLTDQGDRRFKLDFPWDGAKTLQLRANDTAMKDAWVRLLRATQREAESQIEATGSVFAYGGTANHKQDEAYEEAAYLKTNRFVAAYVVDEQSRASYINDLLNEGFQYVGDRAGNKGDVLRACAGARAALTELIAFTEDFKEEMKGVEELRRRNQSCSSSSYELDPSVAAPKIQRFCEEHMSLVGRTISSRLMLELSPFMDSSVAGTSSAPTNSTRAELVATRRKLDEAYEATDQLVVMGTRAWFMDIRDCFLDCKGLQHASSVRPIPSPEVATQTSGWDSPPAASTANNSAEPAGSVPALSAGAPRRSSSAALSQVSSAFSAAKAATKVGASRVSSSLSAQGRSASNNADAGVAADGGVGPGYRDGSGTSKLASLPGVSMSIPALFRRGSRAAIDTEEQKLASSPKKTPQRGSEDLGGGTPMKQRDVEEQRSDLFGGSSRSPSTSPRAGISSAAVSRASVTRGPFSPPRQGTTERGCVTSVADVRRAGDGTSQSGAGLGAAHTSAAEGGSGARKDKRAFAGGIWNSRGSSSGVVPPTTDAPPMIDARLDDGPTAEIGKPAETASGQAGGQRADGSGAFFDSAAFFSVTEAKPRPSGGKRRFAGGGFSAPKPATTQPTAHVPQVDNPFAGGDNAGRNDSGSRVMGGGRGGAMRISAFAGSKQAVGDAVNESEPPVPAWVSAAAGERVPAWAAPDETPSGSGSTNGLGLAPPSRPEQGVQIAADRSPFITVEPVAPPVRRPSQRRPGESGSRRAFGGGERLF